MGHRPYPNATRARNQLWRRYQTPAFTTNPTLAALAESARGGEEFEVAMRTLRDGVQTGLTVAESLDNAAAAAANIRSWTETAPIRFGITKR
ncbi:MAG: hypothetical protein ACJ768_11865 [Gaiellaceae bacterium]